jgi:hypothetical protein
MRDLPRTPGFAEDDRAALEESWPIVKVKCDDCNVFPES